MGNVDNTAQAVENHEEQNDIHHDRPQPGANLTEKADGTWEADTANVPNSTDKTAISGGYEQVVDDRTDPSTTETFTYFVNHANLIDGLKWFARDDNRHVIDEIVSYAPDGTTYSVRPSTQSGSASVPEHQCDKLEVTQTDEEGYASDAPLDVWTNIRSLPSHNHQI